MNIKQASFFTKEVLKEVLPEYCSGLVVDLGCGYGKYRETIEQYSDKYLGIDNQSSPMQFNDNHQLNLDYVADVCNTPLPDNYADTVICTEVLEHVPDPFKLMAEIFRILKPGGRVILSSGWLSPYHPEPKDYWRFSHQGYEELCLKSGLKVTQVYQQGGFYSMICYLFLRKLDLNHRRIFLKLLRLVNLIYKLAGYFDRWSKGYDAVAHLIIAEKELKSG